MDTSRLFALRTLVLSLLLLGWGVSGAAASPLVSGGDRPGEIGLLAEAEADPERVDRAREAFRRGRDAYSEGRFEEAIGHLERANAILPNPRLFLFIGRAYTSLHRYEDALTNYTRFAEASAEFAEEIREELALLRVQARSAAFYEATLGIEDAANRARGAQPTPRSMRRFEIGINMRDVPVQIRSNPSGARVYLDDTALGPIGTTPLDTRLFTGRHLLIIERDNYAPHREVVQVAVVDAGQSIPVFRFDLQRRAVPVVITATEVSARLTYISATGDRRELGVGRFEGELPVGPGTLILQQGPSNRRIPLELAAPADGTPLRLQVSVSEAAAATSAAPRADVGTLRVLTVMEGAEVFVNERPAGASPGRVEVPLSPGRHLLQLRRAGYVTWPSTATISAGEVTEVTAPPMLARERGPLRWPAFVLMPAGAALAGYGAYALATADDDTVVPLGLTIGGAALAATGVVWALLTRRPASSAGRSAEAAPLRWTLSPTQGGARMDIGIVLP